MGPRKLLERTREQSRAKTLALIRKRPINPARTTLVELLLKKRKEKKLLGTGPLCTGQSEFSSQPLPRITGLTIMSCRMVQMPLFQVWSTQLEALSELGESLSDIRLTLLYLPKPTRALLPCLPFLEKAYTLSHLLVVD